MPVIETQDLTKVFRIPQKEPGVRGAFKALFEPHHVEKKAVDGVSFRIDRGEMVGYIGVNGAGKSTTIKMLTGILVFTAAPAVDILWTLPAILYLVIAVLSGGVIFISLNLLTGVSAFWLMDSVPVIRVVFETHEFAKFPLAIYPRAIGILLTWLIPYGFASFYPASYLLGREISPALAWAGPLVAAALFLLAYRAWLFGLRHYGSTGS